MQSSQEPEPQWLASLDVTEFLSCIHYTTRQSHRLYATIPPLRPMWMIGCPNIFYSLLPQWSLLFDISFSHTCVCHELIIWAANQRLRWLTESCLKTGQGVFVGSSMYTRQSWGRGCGMWRWVWGVWFKWWCGEIGIGGYRWELVGLQVGWFWSNVIWCRALLLVRCTLPPTLSPEFPQPTIVQPKPFSFSLSFSKLQQNLFRRIVLTFTHIFSKRGWCQWQTYPWAGNLLLGWCDDNESRMQEKLRL